ncbi:MAG: ParA family protein [Symploca sp. SIO3C6]|nr:ParA family protein [Symploca sp. SIO3C6]NEO99127.1 ParA family protein [Symploca sp. SIO2E9]NET07837.1 ParA family protein [Symploca sp. SIO2B6]NET50710.1 ParA family protein [Merismopedia sp. SIO2A8]
MIVATASVKGGVGKSVTAIHLAAFLQLHAPTLLVDGDSTRSALQWAKPGLLPFRVCDERQGIKLTREFEHTVIDTPGGLAQEEVENLAKGCDLLVVPTTPNALAFRPVIEMALGLPSNFKILLTFCDGRSKLATEQARRAITASGLPLFKAQIPKFSAAFEQASTQGVVVSQVKNSYGIVAWQAYKEIGEELISEQV